MEKPSNKQNIACIVQGPDYIFTGMLLSITRQNCSIRQEAMCYTGSIVWPDDRDAVAWYHPQIEYRLAKVGPSYLQRIAELLANLQKERETRKGLNTLKRWWRGLGCNHKFPIKLCWTEDNLYTNFRHSLLFSNQCAIWTKLLSCWCAPVTIWMLNTSYDFYCASFECFPVTG